jgi:hypothetical protein
MQKQNGAFLVATSLFFLACASAEPRPPAAPHGSARHEAREKVAPENKPSEAASARRVGDFAVHMISGSFRKHPALLTERVIAEENEAWLIEYTLEDTDGTATLRVWIDQNSDQVTKVSRMLDGAEKPATVADFDAMMASASVVPDTNEGLVANSTGTCTLGPAELDCETKSYKVWLGDREASLGVTQSPAVPGADLSGEITAADGSVIYRSELVERGNESETTNDSFALR